jgi:protein-S-isoprenylcysteine O-methyltransferase Ste14
MIAIYVVAGIEARDGAPNLSMCVWPFGLVIFVAGSGMLTWSMVVNPCFEKTVRIQTDRGHRVIDAGPYAYVRHPGYVGFTGWILAPPLLLASAWAFVPAFLSVVGVVMRSLEHDTTRQNRTRSKKCSESRGKLCVDCGPLQCDPALLGFVAAD